MSNIWASIYRTAVRLAQWLLQLAGCWLGAGWRGLLEWQVEVGVALGSRALAGRPVRWLGLWMSDAE
mgnify:CR=1 FL=1|jgi:hypothetical protein